MVNQKALKTIAYNRHTFSWQKLGEKNSHFDDEDIYLFKVFSSHSQLGQTMTMMNNKYIYNLYINM